MKSPQTFIIAGSIAGVAPTSPAPPALRLLELLPEVTPDVVDVPSAAADRFRPRGMAIDLCEVGSLTFGYGERREGKGEIHRAVL
mmetsp:Transcript_18374/g.39480  ORF Transcript_18374/g.39480 Transcript_18374/m.39480 type:complete len:85 (+) Transcript_18374:1925-2179(+)